MSTAADFAGRTFDVVAFQGAKLGSEARLTNALASGANGGNICAGIDKQAQRWLIEFLTITGSLLFLPKRGCQFMFLLQTGQLRTTLDADQAFYLSNSAVKTNLQAEESVTDPDDERFDTAELLSLVVAGDKITLSVQINSLAGTTRKVILPIPVTVKS